MATKRKADETTNDERPRGRQRREEESFNFIPLSLDDINDHCVLEIFKCLSRWRTWIPLQSLDVRRCREVRTDDRWIKLGQVPWCVQKLLLLILHATHLFSKSGIMSFPETEHVWRLLDSRECLTLLYFPGHRLFTDWAMYQNLMLRSIPSQPMEPSKMSKLWPPNYEWPHTWRKLHAIQCFTIFFL